MKRKISSLTVVAVFILALVLVPMFVMTASAESATVSKTHAEMTTIAGVSTSPTGGSVNGKDIKLDDYITVRFDKGSSTSNPAYYDDGIRLYQGGGTLTISANGATIKSVVITAGSSTYTGSNGTVSAGSISTNGTTVTISDVNSENLVFTTGSVKTNRLYVKDISVAYDFSASAPACEHTNTTETTVDATCTEDGSVTVTCTDCGEVISEEKIDAGHKYVNGTCTVCGAVEGSEPVWTLVTNLANLKVGDQIVIVASESAYALSTTQNSNNRGQATVVKDGDTVTFGDDVQIITIDAGTTTGTFAFNVGAGYLYAASSSSNHLKTEATLSANSSWSITIAEDGVATIKSQGDYTRNWLRHNSTSSLFSCYSSGQKDICIYKLDDGSSAPTCEHTNTTEATVNATCTVAGSRTVTCNDCGETVSITSIAATGHEHKTENRVEATCTTDGSVTVTCSDCGEIVSTTTIPAGHNYVNGVCSECGAKLPNYSGKYYIATIRTSGNYFYMTSDLGTASTERYQAVDSGLTALPEQISLASAVPACIFVLEMNDDGTYCIYAEGVDGDNYLGWTSGNSGILVSKDNALKLTVTLKEDGTFNICYNGERYLSLNSSSTSNYFAWYAGTQKQDLSLIPVVTPTIKGANINVSADLAIKYHVNVPEGYNYSELTLRVTNAHGTIVELKSDGTVVNGNYVFVYGGIAPQCISDNVKAELLLGDQVLSTVDNYSVMQNAKNIASNATAELKQLLANLLAYGKAAQEHLGDEHTVSYVTDADISAIGVSATTATPDEAVTDTDRVLKDPTDGNTAYISGAGVVFDNQVHIYVSVWCADGVTACVKVGDETYEIVGNGSKQRIVLGGMNMTEALDALEIKLYVGETAVHEITYGARAYVYQMNAKDDAATIAILATALYNCALSASAYVNP